MNVDWFFRERTKFIRQYHTVAITPFETIRQKIESGEDPYEPPYSEDGEPPFLAEWSDANDSEQIVRRTCVTLLSEAVKLYFETWEKMFGAACQSALADVFKKRGFVAGYTECFRQIVGLEWGNCPANLSIVEQVVLARNISAHHDGDIGSMSIRYPKKVRKKIKSLLFLHDYEKQALTEDQQAVFTFLGSDLVITEATLDEAIRHCELMVDWLEPQLQEFRWRPRNRSEADETEAD